MSTKSQIGLGDRVEVEVSDHVNEVEVCKVVDLELNLEEGELSYLTWLVLGIVLWKTGEEVHVTSMNSGHWHGQMEQTNSIWGSRGAFVSGPTVEPAHQQGFPWPMNLS